MMSRITMFTLALTVFLSPVYSQFYVGEFDTQGDPLAIAVDSNGGIYYTVFTFSGPNATRCYYVASPLSGVSAEEHVLVSDAAETDVAAGRGFTGVAVDSQGNIFLALESGNAQTATVRKLSPAPDFEPVAGFFEGIVFGEKRFNGLDLMDDDTLILSTFDAIEFWDANDSTPLFEVGGFEAFQRDVAFNPLTNDIYISKNGGESTNSVNRLSGGSSDDPTGYTQIENGFISQGGFDSAFGVNGQLIEFDPSLGLLLVSDYSTEPPSLAAYQPENPDAPLWRIDGAESPNGPVAAPADSAVFGDYIFITDNSNQRILLYATSANSVSDWDLF